jgi:adenine-specific DNA-methyltransferase
MKPFDKLKTKLAELFQLDQADLDFGIYRIMNARRDDITRFLERDLLPQVQDAFKQYKSSDRVAIQKELDKVIEGVKAAGMDPEQSPRVKELREELAKGSVDVTALENEVYDHLYSFFSRYYDEGDFISLRRYREGVYAIPYEGEEVKLHWANHDQYYVKTAEYFRDYAFKMPNGHRVHFKIIEADTEKDNTKASNGKDRRFFLHGDLLVSEENGELVIRFEYRPDDEKRKQDEINAGTVRSIIEGLNETQLSSWQKGLNVKWKRADGTVSDKTILEKHLYDYTRRNTFDYFIHKDLGGFLRRELDFYIKNEIMRLDDIEEKSAPRVEQYLSKIKVIRRIAHKIIDFLAQIEDFQKKLWLKKKFVIETNYCVTLDRMPEDLYPEIAANEAQREEWVRLFAIDENKENSVQRINHSNPISIEFLKTNPFLVLDTKFFNEEFKNKLLKSCDEIDHNCHGLLIHGENIQALRLLNECYRHKIALVFADPPYNTGVDGFPYKDSYQHSSWLAMMEDRLITLGPLLSPKALLFLTIDFVEVSKLRLLCDSVFGATNFLADVAWEKRYTRSNNAKCFYSLKDTVLCYRSSEALDLIREDRSEKSKKNYTNPDNDPRGPWISSSYVNPATRAQRPNLVYPIRNPFTGKDIEHPSHAWKYDPETHQKHVADNRLYWGLDGNHEFPRLKSFLSEAPKGMVPIDVWHYKETGTTDDGGKVLKALFGGEVFDNPKPPSLVRRAISLSPENPDSLIVLDHFAGSGTTAEAVIESNRNCETASKYILVEMGEHFSTVLHPRIQKVVYSSEWKDGKPVSRDTGISHMFKYIRLESYEDALANIEFKRTPQQLTALDKSESFRESYMLRYMLDTEAKGSQTLLNIDNFDDPFSYKLLVGTGSVGETRSVNADLVETFNWLLGLKVRRMDFIRGFRIVEGENPEGEKVLVIWRKIRDLSETIPAKIAAAREKANNELEEFFRKQQYNTLDSEFDVIYVNGDNNLMNIPLMPEKQGIEPRYKVRLIEDEFKRLVFEVNDI